MWLSLGVGALGAACAGALDPTHGVTVGDVSHSRATVWSRSDENSTMQVSIYECDGRVDGEETTGDVEVDSTGDYTGLVDVSDLSPDTCYEAEVYFSASGSSLATSNESATAYATFNTAPRPSVMRAVRFAWGGDLAGQNICRDATEGFPLMEAMNSVEGMDFFLNVGDAIYADGLCNSTGLGGNEQVEGDFERSSDLENFWAHWKYNLEDPGYQALVSSRAFFMTWDDHEVVDDFGPGFDERSTPSYTAGVSLLPIGMEAFLNYNPIRATTDPSEPTAFYRTIRWGQGVELFILDTRQYRSLATDSDTVENRKTMLGDTQLTWLKGSLTNSTALWKIVVSSVPLSIPTGPSDEERDGWANFEGDTGYEIELEDILEHLRSEDISNIVFITADVHFAQSLRYQPFANDTSFEFHEMVVGPLNAGTFTEKELDQSFSPESLFAYAANHNALSGKLTYEEFKPYFNFGLADIDEGGNLTFSVINTASETVYSMTLEPRETIATTDGTPAPSPASSPSVGGASSSTPVSSDGEQPTSLSSPAPSTASTDDTLAPVAQENSEEQSAAMALRGGTGSSLWRYFVGAALGCFITLPSRLFRSYWC